MLGPSDEADFEKKESTDQDIQVGLDLYEDPIRNCLEAHSFMKIFLFQNSLLLWYFITLLCIFYRMNLASLVYATYLLRINLISFYPKLFKETTEEADKRIRVSRMLKWLLVVASGLIFTQYGLLLGAPHKVGQDQGWKVSFVGMLCSGESKEFQGCMEDWEQWLSLGYFNAPDLLIDCLMLSSIYMCLFFMNGQIQVDEKEFEMEGPQLGDHNDFIFRGDAAMIHFYFSGLPYVLVFYMLFVAATFHGAGMSDAISTVYLFIAFYYILNWRKLYTRNQQMLTYLRNFNRTVIFCILLF